MDPIPCKWDLPLSQLPVLNITFWKSIILGLKQQKKMFLTRIVHHIECYYPHMLFYDSVKKKQKQGTLVTVVTLVTLVSNQSSVLADAPKPQYWNQYL